MKRGQIVILVAVMLFCATTYAQTTASAPASGPASQPGGAVTQGVENLSSQAQKAEKSSVTKAPATQQATTNKLSQGQKESKKPSFWDTEDADRVADDSRGMIYQMLAYVIVILIFGVIAIVVIRKVMPRISGRETAGKQIAILESTYLAPRQAVYLLQVGEKKILVGSTKDRLTNLGDVTGSFQQELDMLQDGDEVNE